MATRKSRRRVHQPPSTYDLPVTETEAPAPALFIAGMAITQTSAPVITGVCKVGEELTATPGTYEGGEIKNTKWYYSDNGGADWVVKGVTRTQVLTADDVGRVFKCADVVGPKIGQDGETVEFDSDKTGVIYPADAKLGTLTVDGPATGVVGTSQTFTASVDGDADSKMITWAWEIQDAKGVKRENVSWVDPTANPATVTFSEPASAVKVVAYAGTEQTNVIDSPVTGSSVYDSQSVAPDPEPGAELGKKTDTVLEGEPFTGNILTIIPGTAQGGEAPYTEAYSWEAGTDGSWDVIDGFAGISYSLGGTDKGKSIRGVVTITDAKGATLRLASLGTGIVDDEPEQIVPGGELGGNAQYQAASILYWYRRWHNRDFVVTPVSTSTFSLTPNGKLEDFGRMAYTPTEGEKELVIGWLTDRWDGDIAVEGSKITLTCVGGGNFHPSGGGSPRSLTVV